MRVPTTGLILPLDEAKTQLVDFKGNLIEFEEQENGTFQSKEVQGDSYNYSYTLSPHPAIVTVTVNKVKRETEEAKKKRLSAEEKKALEEAKTIAEQAPDTRTRKEAERYAAAIKK